MKSLVAAADAKDSVVPEGDFAMFLMFPAVETAG
jgi:hypothetical protein